MSKLYEMLREKNEDAYLALRLEAPQNQDQLMAAFVVFYEAYEAYSQNSDPMVGKIKITWWRERLEELRVEKQPRPHPALLALKKSPEQCQDLLSMLDEFEKVIDGWQPKTIAEIELFISNTFGKLFSICAEISNTPRAKELGIAYGSFYFLKKLQQNNNFLQISEDVEKIITSQLEKNTQIQSPEKSAFSIIINHHLGSKSPKHWKLLLKLFLVAKRAF